MPSGISVASVREPPSRTPDATRRSGGDALNRPRRRMRVAAAIADAVVQPRRAPLPEFDLLGHETIAAPVRRPRDVLARARVLRLDGGEALLEHFPAGDRLALRRRPRAEACGARPLGEVRARFGVVDVLDRALDAHLALELGPVEEQRRIRMRGELAPLAAAVVGVEHEAALVERLEQDDPRARAGALA